MGDSLEPLRWRERLLDLLRAGLSLRDLRPESGEGRDSLELRLPWNRPLSGRRRSPSDLEVKLLSKFRDFDGMWEGRGLFGRLVEEWPSFCDLLAFKSELQLARESHVRSEDLKEERGLSGRCSLESGSTL